jgi:hypothetical protein
MAEATEPCAPRTYRVGSYRVLAALTIGACAWLPLATAASWDPTPLPPPPVQPVPPQGRASQDSRLRTNHLQPGDIVALQVIPYRE